MKDIEIEVVTSIEKTISSPIKLTIPTIAKYYTIIDDGTFFPRGEIIIAIIPVPKYKDYFKLVSVEKNIQNFTDFLPRKDCRQDFWLHETGIRKEVFYIFANDWRKKNYTEITEEEFYTKREQLLNKFKEY